MKLKALRGEKDSEVSVAQGSFLIVTEEDSPAGQRANDERGKGLMPSETLPAILETIEEHTEKVRRIPLPVRREELRWDHIRNLGQEKASELLGSVLDARERLRDLRGAVRDCLEACVLRGLLAMAEKDLLREVAVQRSPRKRTRTGKSPRGGYYRSRKMR